MRRALLGAGIAGLALSSTLVVAQGAPESILPPGLDKPAASPRPAASASPAPTSAPSAGATSAGPPAPPAAPGGDATASAGKTPAAAPAVDLAKLPTLRQLEAMSTDELDELFGLKPKFDIPAGARRSLERVGVIAPEEGGLPVYSLAGQPAPLVRAVLAGLRRPVVSRWGHILLRRALASRLDAPAGMDPADFAALRAAALNALGEHGAARALVQDVDTGNYSPALTDAAVAAYVGTADLVGACPAILLGTAKRDDPEWKMLAGVCHAYDGEETRAQNDLRKLQIRGEGERIDTLLAMRLAGAAGTGRKSVTIEWNNVTAMTPLRFALVNAVGESIPDTLTATLAPAYLRTWASLPMATPAQRMLGAGPAGQAGILSSAAMVDLYSQVYAMGGDGVEGDLDAANRLREAYVANDPAARLAAIKGLWDGAEGSRYGRMVLTAYAAARLTPDDAFAEDAGPLIASMLAAGLDRDALRWAGVVEDGSLGWALLALARPGEGTVSAGDFDSFAGDDASNGQRKAKLLLAALGGLGRMDEGAVNSAAADLGAGLGGATRWSRAIDAAAAADNRALVALLAGLGMQGTRWDQMTPRHLYHITAGLRRVGLDAEARMIAAEAVARA